MKLTRPAKILWRLILPNLRYLPQSRFRVCGCCERRTLVISLSEGEEAKRCVRCRANLRYEMLASYVREHADLAASDVLELDSNSPLKGLLSGARTYTPSNFSPDVAPGTIRGKARCEDITHLTYGDESLDMIVSSDVLEHVPDLEAALRETERVLRPGGFHVFTVPPKQRTVQRAKLVDGAVHHLVEPPDYHMDPENPEGILCYWELGIEDGPERFSTPGLKVEVVAGPQGRDQRVLWAASRPAEHAVSRRSGLAANAGR